MHYALAGAQQNLCNSLDRFGEEERIIHIVFTHIKPEDTWGASRIAFFLSFRSLNWHGTRSQRAIVVPFFLRFLCPRNRLQTTIKEKKKNATKLFQLFFFASLSLSKPEQNEENMSSIGEYSTLLLSKRIVNSASIIFISFFFMLRVVRKVCQSRNKERQNKNFSA